VAPAEGPEGAPGERPEVLVAEEPSDERKKVLAARRRLLGMLLALALGSCVLAVAKMAAWWVIVPPFTMLTGYLALLREASKVDAERREPARARVTEETADQGAPPATVAGPAPAAGAAAVAAPAAPVAPPPAPPVPDAEVIDISASVGQGGKEFYDQYADAKLRAVGDLPRSTAA
jgi:hypothetical protein